MAFFKKYRKYIILALLITVFLLIARFLFTIDLELLKTYLSDMPGMFAGVVLMSLLAYTASTLAWLLCMGSEARKVPFVELFMFRHVGEMLSLFNPTGIVAGESLKAVILNKRGVSGTDSVSSILLQRVLVILSGIVLMVVSVLYLTAGQMLNGGSVLLILVALAFIAFLAYLVIRFLVHPTLFLGKTMEKLKKKTGWNLFSDKLVASSYEMNEVSSRYFRENKKRFLLAFLMCLIHWIFGAMEFYIVLNMMGLPVSVIQASAVEMGVILFKTIGAIVPGQIGVEEYGNKVMLNAIGVVSNEVWLVVTLMRRGRQLFWLLVAGIFMLIISKQLQLKLHK